MSLVRWEVTDRMGRQAQLCSVGYPQDGLHGGCAALVVAAISVAAALEGSVQAGGLAGHQHQLGHLGPSTLPP